jgi:hypothetical protein
MVIFHSYVISELGLSVVPAGSDVLSPVWWQRWRYRELPLAGAEVGAVESGISGYVWQWSTPKFQWNIIIFSIRWGYHGISYHIIFFLGDKMWGLTINNRDIFPMSWRLSDCLGFSLPSLCPTWLDCCCALHPCSIRKFHPDSWPERHGVWKWPRAKAFCTKAAWPIVAMGFPKPKLLSFATTSNN